MISLFVAIAMQLRFICSDRWEGEVVKWWGGESGGVCGEVYVVRWCGGVTWWAMMKWGVMKKVM